MKKFLSMVVAVFMILTTMTTVAFAEASVTMNGVGYTSIAEALEAVYAGAEGDYVIDLSGEFTESVTILQKENKSVTINGVNSATFVNAGIVIDGESRSSGAEFVTITGINFDYSTATTDADCIKLPKKRVFPTNVGHDLSYAHNVSIENCTFEGNPNYAIVAVRTAGGGSYNLEIEACSGSYLHSIAQLSGTNGVEVEDCNFTNLSEGGLNLQNSHDVEISNVNIEAGTYGVRMGQGSSLEATSYTIENSTIDAKNPVVARGEAEGNTQITVTGSKLLAADGEAPITLAADGENPVTGAAITITANENYWSSGVPAIETADGYAATEEIETYYATEDMTAVDVAPDAAVTGVAYVNGIFYATLEDAITAAKDGDTISLLGNVIDVNVDKDGYNQYKSLTFANGTLDFTNAGAGTAMFWLWENDVVNFYNIKFVKNYKENASFMCYLVDIEKPSAIATFTNCEFDFNTAISSSYIANNGGGKLVFTNCKINECNGSNFVYNGGVLFDNCVYNTMNGDIIAHNNFPSEIRNSTVTTKRIRIRNNPLKASGDPTLKVTGNSTIYAKDGVIYTENPAAGEENAWLIIESGSKLTTDFIYDGIIDEQKSTGVIEEQTDAITVEFEKVESEEGTLLYNINLVGSGNEVINRLNSADLTFNLTTDEDMDYEIIASNSEVAVNAVNNLKDRYEFHFDGKDAVVDTANVITIGRVKFRGYGDFTFCVDENANATNVAHATTIFDNIVESFVVADGTLVIDGANSIISTTIQVPTRELKIDICFPNSVEKKAAAYQQMKVTVAGGDLDKDIVIELGDVYGDTDLTYAEKAGAKYNVSVDADGCYIVTFEKVLTVNNSYTVTVEGAGYRTARYTVTMTDDKELNFWNNVMDEAQVVEVGKDSSKAFKNFLAGDIVKDANINIYDLSAVVSYFGTTNDTATESDYAKYDLNRDGLIDSKDVAYVLVSWGE